MKPVVVRPAAEEDMEAAYLWYEGRQAHLGNGFLIAVRSALIQVSRYPEAHPILDSDVRRAMVPSFLTDLLSLVSRDCLRDRLLAKRNPERWRSRILA
jgi:hypothetical protein